MAVDFEKVNSYREKIQPRDNTRINNKLEPRLKEESKAQNNSHNSFDNQTFLSPVLSRSAALDKQANNAAAKIEINKRLEEGKYGNFWTAPYADLNGQSAFNLGINLAAITGVVEGVAIPMATRALGKIIKSVTPTERALRRNLGTFEDITNTATGKAFGDYITRGTEQSIFENAINNNKVLKILRPKQEITNIQDLRKVNNKRTELNSLKNFEKIKLKGYVTDKSNNMFPVYSQNKVEIIDPNRIKEALYDLSTELERLGYIKDGNGFYKEGIRFGDISGKNIGSRNGKIKIIDASKE